MTFYWASITSHEVAQCSFEIRRNVKKKRKADNIIRNLHLQSKICCMLIDANLCSSPEMLCLLFAVSTPHSVTLRWFGRHNFVTSLHIDALRHTVCIKKHQDVTRTYKNTHARARTLWALNHNILILCTHIKNLSTYRCWCGVSEHYLP